MQPNVVRPVRRFAGALSFALAMLALLASVSADEGDSRGKPTPARTAVLARTRDAGDVRATPVDWSGYRGIRRYSPYYVPGYVPGYAVYRPYYYGNYAYRPWYARPYAYAYGYPGYAPPYYRYPAYAYSAWAVHAPYAWGGFYPPAVAVAPPVVAAPQVYSTRPAAAADDVGCFYW